MHRRQQLHVINAEALLLHAPTAYSRCSLSPHFNTVQLLSLWYLGTYLFGTLGWIQRPMRVGLTFWVRHQGGSS
jgi:hypothetical protein